MPTASGRWVPYIRDQRRRTRIIRPRAQALITRVPVIAPRGRRFAPPAPGGGGGGPPAPSGTIILDTRAGGAQDVTGAATLAAAEAIAGTSHSSNGYAVDWALTFQGGVAWIVPWKHLTGGAEVDTQINKAGMDFQGIFCGQYETWFGRQSGDNAVGGSTVGAVGFYDQTNGHKSGVIFRRDETGGGSTNDARHTTYHNYHHSGSPRGQAVSYEGYIELLGTSTGGNDSTHVNDTTKSMTVNQFAGGSFSLHIWKGTGSGQTKAITANNATQFTTAAFAPVPDATSQYRVLGPEYCLMQDDTADPTLGITGGLVGGIAPILDLDSYQNQIDKLTWKLTPESAAGALDGRYEEWFGNTKVFDIQNARTGPASLPWKEWIIGGPTWTNNGPSADCTQYIRNLVIWNPAS